MKLYNVHDNNRKLALWEISALTQVYILYSCIKHGIYITKSISSVVTKL